MAPVASDFPGMDCVGLFFTSQSYITYKYAGGRVMLGLILKLQMSEWYAWGLIAPALVWFARRFPLERGRWPRNLAGPYRCQLVGCISESWIG